MEHIIDHVASGLAAGLAVLAVFLSRRGLRATRRGQKLSDIVPKAVDAAIHHLKQGDNAGLDLRFVACKFAESLDAEDGKRDFPSEKLFAEVSAEITRRGL